MSTRRVAQGAGPAHEGGPSAAAPHLESSRILLSAASLIVSNIMVAVLAVVTVHVTAQHLGPRAFGRFSTVTSFVLMFALLADLGVTSVTTRDVARAPDRAADVIGKALGLRLALSLVAAPLLTVAALLLYPAQRSTIGVGVGLLSIDLFLVSAQTVTQAYYSGRVRNEVPALLLVVCKLLYLLGTVVAVSATRASILPLLAAYVGADAVVAVVSTWLVWRRIHFRLQLSVSSWMQLVVVSVPLGGMQVVNRLYSRLDSVLLSLLRSPIDVAEYNIAFNFTDVLSNLPAFVMASVLPSLVHSGTGEKLKQKLQLVLDAVLWFAVPIAVGGFVLRTQIVGLVAGPGYQGAAAPMAILILSVVLSFPQVVFVWGCLAINEYRLLFPAMVLTTAANLGLNLVLIPPFGPSGAAGAQLGTECLSLALTYAVFERKSRLRFRLGTITRAISAAAIMVPAGLWLRGAWHTPLQLLNPFIGTAVLSAVYLGSSFVVGAVPSAVLFQLERVPGGRRISRTNGAAMRACRTAGHRALRRTGRLRAGARRPAHYRSDHQKEPKA